EGSRRGVIGGVRGLVLGDGGAHVLGVEARLRAGVEALDQLLERRAPSDDDDLVELGHGRHSPSRSRSGTRAFRSAARISEVIVRFPTRPAFWPSSLNASARIVGGSSVR